MEASYLPKMEGQGRKQKEQGHSLLFDSAMTDRVLRQNAYEERLLLRRTENIEKEKQQTLEEHSFSKSQFLLRFLPVMKRQNALRKELLSKVFDSENTPETETTAVERTRPQSSYRKIRSRTSTASGRVKPNRRRTVSAEMTFPSLNENMDDILNGYRTPKPQSKSVSPSKMRLRGNWDLASNTQAKIGKSSAKISTSKSKTISKNVDFAVPNHQTFENIDNLTNSMTFDHSINASKGKKMEHFTNISVENFANHEQDGKLKDTEWSIPVEGVNQTQRDLTKPEKIPKDVLNERTFLKQLKFSQKNRTLPEYMINDLIHTLKTDTNAASKTSRFLAKMINNERHSDYHCVEEDSGDLVSFHLGNVTNDVHLLSDVKKRQRYETQRLRIMRTIVLAYDTAWNERVKKISTAA